MTSISGAGGGGGGGGLRERSEKVDGARWKRKSLAGYFPAGIFIGGSAMLGRRVGGRGGGEGQEGGGGRGLAVAPGNAPAPASNRTWRGGGPRAGGRPSGAEGGAGLLQATGPLPPRRTPLLNVLRVSPRGGVTGITAFRGQNPTRTHGERSPLSI